MIAELVPELRDHQPVVYESRQFSDNLVEGIKILLMTATPIELEGIMHYLKPKDGNTKIIETFTNTEAGKEKFYIGKYGKYPVVVGMSAPAKSHQGPLSASYVATKLMNTFKPRYVIAVGICYGMDRSNASSGDVIVSSIICDFTCLRAGETLQPRGGTPTVGRTLLSLFGSPGDYSHNEGAIKVKVRCGAFIARSDLVDNPIYKQQLKSLKPDALGGEMEGAGIMSAIENATYSGVEAIVIKAICDWGDGKKSESTNLKSFSSRAAARYVHYQMDKLAAPL